MKLRRRTLLVLLCLFGQVAAAQAAEAHDIVFIRQPESFVVESSGVGAVDVVRGTHGRGPASVRAATQEGDATAGSDYTPADTVLHFPDPVGEQEFTFPIANDTTIELLETVGIRLSEPTGGVTIAGTPTGTVTIIDEDGPARVSFSKASVDTYENFPRVELVVIRSGGIEGVTSFDYATSDGTALAASDYEATSGTITFDVGQRIKRFTIPLRNDTVREEQEAFSVGLTAVTGAQSAEPSSVEVAIEDDENPASDTTPPVTFFHQPLDGRTYRAGSIRDLLVQTDDLDSGIKRVQMALRAKMKNGNCRWYKHRIKGFAKGSCNKKIWGIGRAGADTVYYTLPEKLRPSRGTKIRNYTAWSRGIDQVGNVERSFQKTRNFSRFEVR